jgi:SAM-dependent methyltransferase
VEPHSLVSGERIGAWEYAVGDLGTDDAITAARSTCRSCASADLRAFLSLGDMPLTDAYVTPSDSNVPERRYPLEVVFCPRCTLVQIPYTVPPEEIFEDYSYYSSFSDTLLSHSAEHALQLIAERELGPNSLVLEVASNDGYLLRNFVGQRIPVLGIDPARGPAEAAEDAGIPTLRRFFGPELAAALRADGKRADVLLANNVLAHVPDLNGFVEGIATVLADDGIAEIEVPYLRDLIDNLEFDTIYHEHLCYFSLSALDVLFRRHGLSLNRVRRLPVHGGSLRATVGRVADHDGSVERLLEEEQRLGMATFEYYNDFAERVRNVQRALEETLRSLRAAGKRIAAYGAAAKGTILLNSSGIGADLIDFVADRNPHKQGHSMPGIGVPIVPPERILDEQPDYVLLLSWNFKDEVLNQQRAYLEAGGTFIVPIPAPTFVGGSSNEPPGNG